MPEFKKFLYLAIFLSTIQKTMLYSSENRAFLRACKIQGHGLELQGQGIQNLSSRASSRPRTSSRTPLLVVALSASKNIQKNDAQRTKWQSSLTSDLTMTPFFNFWLYNFNLKPLSRNHPSYGASCITTLDAAWSLGHR